MHGQRVVTPLGEGVIGIVTDLGTAEAQGARGRVGKAATA